MNKHMSTKQEQLLLYSSLFNVRKFNSLITCTVEKTMLPSTVEACGKLKINPEDLLDRNLAFFRQQNQDEERAKWLYKNNERQRWHKMKIVRDLIVA